GKGPAGARCREEPATACPRTAFSVAGADPIPGGALRHRLHLLPRDRGHLLLRHRREVPNVHPSGPRTGLGVHLRHRPPGLPGAVPVGRTDLSSAWTSTEPRRGDLPEAFASIAVSSRGRAGRRHCLSTLGYVSDESLGAGAVAR